jgi:GNAT superfamily N-acetyltransferase
MRLENIEPQAYVREVLPLTAALWAGERSFDRYAEHTLEIAHSGYGRRHYRTIGMYDENDVLLASFKRYERTLLLGGERLRAVGIGAVYTAPALRGRGYASAMLAMELDRARAQGMDAAYLFSDIRPEFYADIGFIAMDSRSISLRSDTLDTTRIEVARLEEDDWTGVARCFEIAERRRAWSFARTPLVWSWIRLRMRQGSEHPGGVPTNLVVRRGRAIAAYVLGARAPQHDAYVIDEFGFADAQAATLVPALLRSAAGDLRRVTGWLPPPFARETLPRAAVRKRTTAIFMAAPLSPAGRRWIDAAAADKSADGIWSTDHV